MIVVLLISVVYSAEVKLKMESSAKDIRRINGRAEFDSQEYEASCQCESTTSQLHVGETFCDPTKVQLHQDFAGDDGKTASFEQIRNLIGPLNELQFGDPNSYHFSCLDGRNEKGVLGTPGGDFGEFLLALSVYEQTIRTPLVQDTVDSILSNYLQYMKQEGFYMCTDDDALKHLEKELGMTLTVDALIDPPNSLKNDLLTSLLKSENTGCMHLKSILKNPESYDMRPELAGYLIRSYFTILWNKSNPLHHRLILEVMAGRHEERAFLEVRINEACIRQNMAPLLRPKRRITLASVPQGDTSTTFHEGGTTEIFQAYINHIDAASIRRKELSKFFAENSNLNGVHFEIDVMHHRLNKKGLMYLEITGQKVARYLPFYTVTIV
ncbi:unnamed protein product [Paramecium octaurelia]|uniref:Uncharacterized protein n=1 Tax=Paramecium octaurelia TaxID=43137 RepID=A0A8S1XWK4_PAROT|nr:unnamed protein product [Paramecium octaurelia]